MATKTGLSQTAIVRIWRAFGLQPHRVENFKFSKDPQFVEKVRDIVGLYLNPPDRAIVLCVDEKSQVQALNRTQPILPLAPGVPARQSHDYERHGVTSLFAAMDVASGVTISNCYRRHRHQEFLRFLSEVDANLPRGVEVHLVMDNLNIHRRKSLTDLLGEEIGGEVWGRFTIHYTPTHGSWLNQAEIEIGILSRQCLGTRRIPDLKILRREVQAWNRRMNRARIKINWRFDRRAARRKFGYKKKYFRRSKN